MNNVNIKVEQTHDYVLDNLNDKTMLKNKKYYRFKFKFNLI
jgi:predicted transglutaminase-like cysteine proteinase